MLHGFQSIEVSAGNFERTKRFYREVLGAAEADKGGPHRAEFHLGALTVVVRPLRAGWAPVVNCVMPVIATDRLEEDLAALIHKGVAVLRPLEKDAHGLHAEIADPDGYRIGLWQPPAGAKLPKLYTEAEFARRAAAMQRDLREALTVTRKVPEIRSAAAAKKAAPKKTAAKKAKPAKKKSRR